MARDIAQRELDQSGYRIANLGMPSAPGDATKTDNAHVPLPPSAQGAPGTSLLAAPADHVHPATPGAPGTLAFSDPTEQAVTGTTEQVVAEFVADIGPLLQNGPTNLEASLMAVVRVDSGSATFNVRMGGTPGLPDGQIIAAAVTTSTTYERRGGGGVAFPSPADPPLIKITAVTDDPATSCRIRSKNVVLRT